MDVNFKYSYCNNKFVINVILFIIKKKGMHKKICKAWFEIWKDFKMWKIFRSCSVYDIGGEGGRDRKTEGETDSMREWTSPVLQTLREGIQWHHNV